MIRLAVLALIVCLFLLQNPLSAEPLPQVDGKVDRVFVIRRTFSGEAAMNRNIAAHSALLLRTSQEKWYVLEFMGDGKVYLTPTEQELIEEYTKESWAKVKLKGRFGENGKVNPVEKKLDWTRQLKGGKIDAKFTPQQLKEQMEGLVSKYSLSNENCHAAQERLRRSLGLKVD